MKSEDYGYVVKNNVCLFMKGPLSNWWGGFSGQNGGFSVDEFEFANLLDTELEMDEYIVEHYERGEPIEFNCVEQWMMACKAVLHSDVESFEKIMASPKPIDQKALGRQVKNFDNEKWAEVRRGLVKIGIRRKYEQNFELDIFLRSFNVHTLFAETNPNDSIWGIGLSTNDPKALNIENWNGLNLLGEITREIRQEID